MAVPFDLSKTVAMDHCAFFAQHRDVLFHLDLADGGLDIEGKWLFFNVALWQPLIKRNLPITKKRHLFYNKMFDKQTTATIFSAIYQDILTHCPADAVDVRFEFEDARTTLYNKIAFELGDCHRGIDAVAIARTMRIPEVAAATRFTIAPEDNIQKIEKDYQDAAAKVLAVMAKPELRHNAFFPYVSLNMLNAAQFPQVVMAGGPRTDVDDTMFTTPILGSYMHGFRNIVEYAIDSRAAAKSEWYNASTMGKAQYSNRKLQLLGTAVRYIYSGDCGSTVTVPFHIASKYAQMLVGKNIIEGGRLVELTWDNIRHFCDRRVQLRSSLTCRYQDGFCRVCGGRLVDYMPPGVVPGIAAEHEVMAPIAQLVLSNKHVAKTKATTYILPGPLRDQDLFDISGNEIYFRPHVKLSSVALGMPFKTVERLKDLEHVKGEAINDQYFTDVTELVLGHADTLEPYTPPIRMTDDNKNYPHLSGATLHMLRRHPEALQQAGDMVWVRFDQFNRERPVMYSTVVNDSTRVFVQRVEYMFTRKIQDYTSLGDVLKHFSEIVWNGGVKSHIMHLETCIKANLITDDVDYSIPVVTDPDNVRFAPLAQIIPRRSIGPQIAFEQWNNYSTDVSTFIFPKRTSLFDGFMGFND